MRGSERLFPLLVLAVLAGLTFWLERLSQPPEAVADGRQRHDPDFYVEGFHIRRFGPDGLLQHSLYAQRMEHYPDDDSTYLLAPRLNWHRPTLQVLSADSATLDAKGETAHLINNVQLIRPGTRGAPTTTIVTDWLIVRPEEESARTEAPVTITQGASRLEGIGLIADRQNTVLGGPAHGVIHRQARHTDHR